MKYASVAAFLATILLTNYVTGAYGEVTVLGFTATAGTLLAGLSFVLRDQLQDAIRASLTSEVRGRGHMAGVVEVTTPKDWAVALRVVAVVAVGAALSFLVSDPALAVASAAAFGLAELADLTIYTPLRKRGYLRAAIASNVVGSVVDTFVFLWLAAPFLSQIVPGFSVTGMAPEQVAGKLAVTGATVVLVAACRVARTLRASRRVAVAA